MNWQKERFSPKKLTVRNLQYGPKTGLIRGIYVCHNVWFLPGKEGKTGLGCCARGIGVRGVEIVTVVNLCMVSLQIVEEAKFLSNV